MPRESVANDLYSNILQSPNIDLNSRSSTTQANDSVHGSDTNDLWYDEDSPFEASENLSYQFHTIGYRDGIIAGKEAGLQEGFNIGFKDSVVTGYNWGLMRGVSSAMASLPGGLKEKLVETEETRNKFQQVHESVQPISSTDALKLFYEDQRRQSLKQEAAESSSAETDQNNQSPDVGVLENYHVHLQSILHESPFLSLKGI